MLKLYLDPGHGTLAEGVQDPGAVAGGLRECDVALEVARSVMALLPSWVASKICRTDNESPKGVDERADEANSWGADLVLSLHCNSFSEVTANGVEALIMGTGGKAELCATELLAYYVSATGAYNRGIKVRSDLGILRRTKAPAVLLELGFLTNKNDAAMLKNGQAVMAAAIAEGIVTCARILGKAGADDETTSEYAELPVIHAVTIPPTRFKVIKWGKGKRTDTIQNYASGVFQASGTVPVGNVVANGVWLSRGPGMTTVWVDADGKIGFGQNPPENVLHAFSGIPLIAEGKRYTFAEGQAEGWDDSPFYPTSHTIFGIGWDGKFRHYTFLTTNTGVEASFAEILAIAAALDLRFAMLADGGLSTIVDHDGENVIVSKDNRQLAALIRF